MEAAEAKLYPEMTMNFRRFRDDLVRFEPRLANVNMSIVGDLVTEFCDERTQGIVVAYILGAQMTDVGDIYRLEINDVQVALEHAAASIGLGLHEMTTSDPFQNTKASA